MKYSNSFILYLLVGGINTIIGFGIIFLLMFLGVNAELSNLSGYACGFICSYFLNKSITFKSKNSHKKDFIRFLIVTGIIYLINIAILFLLYKIFYINPYISQIIAGIFYTISGYCFNKLWTFKSL